MPPQTKTTARRPVLTALCLAAICLLVAVVSAATATAAPAGQFKAVFCAGNVGSNGFGTGTNTTSPQNPGGIFSFENYCGPAPDPAGNAAFLRIAENQASGSAGNGAYGFVHWDTPPFVHFKTAGGWTRQPLAFNDGWRARFWGVDFANNGFQIFSQGVGAPAGTTSTFAPPSRSTACGQVAVIAATSTPPTSTRSSSPSPTIRTPRSASPTARL
jgi:hypothetical protein